MNAVAGIWNGDATGISQFDRDGFHLIPAVAGADDCDRLIAELMPLYERHSAATAGKVGGVRNLLRTSPRTATFANSAKINSLIRQFADDLMVPVRAIFFDKNPDANWRVPWHQDLAIALSEQIDTPGFGGWSVKDGVPHVHPPADILEGMVTLRLHLDDCPGHNGALRVFPGSHRAGKLGADDITRWTATVPAFICERAKGDALLMRPLILHASPPAELPGHRRVLHIEYAPKELPNGLKWFDFQ